MKVKVKKRHSLSNVMRKHGWWVTKYGAVRFGYPEDVRTFDELPY